MLNEHFINEFMRTLLVMSISGGIVALVLFAIKPILKHRIPKTAQYYLWLIAVAALLIPFSQFIKLPVADDTVWAVMPDNVVHRYVITSEEEMDQFSAADVGVQDTQSQFNAQQFQEIISPISKFVTIFCAFYPFGVLAVLLYNIISYFVFTKLHKRRNTAANEKELTVLSDLCDRHRVPILNRNPLASTPMLIGLFHPMIILPDREYTEAQLSDILLHELKHLKRNDIIVKWLSLLACSVHWFNPLAWLVRQEIDKACELSCDEAVIRDLDAGGKQNYGDTLIYVAADSKTPKAVLSTTMCEEKKALKERLGAIMKHKRFSIQTIVLSFILVVAVFVGAVALGAASSEPIEPFTPNDTSNNNIITKPIITLYGYNQNISNGDPNDIRKHFTHVLNPDPEVGWTALTNEIYIDVQIPNGTVSVRTYYAESGTEATEHIMLDITYSDPYMNEGGAIHTEGNTWRISDDFPISFMGHIWAITTDAEGVEHYTSIINACDSQSTVGYVSSTPFSFDNQYIKELEQGHHTGDLDPENVLAECVLLNYPDKKYTLDDFELLLDEDMKKVYVYPDESIEIWLVAYDIETSYGDIVRVWSAQHNTTAQ